MTNTHDEGADELAREQARMLLDSWSPFARVSRRLLGDLVERGRIVTIPPGETIELRDNEDTWVMLHPGIEVIRPRSEKGKPLAVGAHDRSAVEGRAGKSRALQNASRAGDPHENKPQRRYESASAALLNAGSATPELAWAIEAHRLNQTDTQKAARRTINRMCRPELVWCDTDIGSRAHLEPLVHLLAYTIARDLDETTVVVTLGPRADGPKSDRRAVMIWNRDEDGEAGDELPKGRPLTANDLYGLVNWSLKRRRRSHVFVLDLTPSGRRPAALAKDLKFDRIVQLTDRIPDKVPAELRDLLDDGLFVKGDDAPYYCAFIASVIVARDVRARSHRAQTFEARRVRSARRRAQEKYRSLSRIDRDACVVPVDLEALAEQWRRWSENPSTPFFDAISEDSISRASVARWGRAVTNRRIGLALSGGGACAFRAGPLLERMKSADMPIDVFAGLSGGALVGAFYCHSGLPGFNRLVALGRLIQLTVPLATVTTWPLELVLDSMLGGTRVEELEIRLAAVAVALPPDDPPMTQVVVSGTLGEAVRVSGTLPPVFGKTTKGGMPYTDGGAGSVVPAQVARDFGADIVLAFNAIPGPSQSNPYPPWLRGAIAIGAPLMQRQIDYYAWHSYFWRQVSQRFLREADVAFEFQPDQVSLLEAGEWFRSAAIVERAKQEMYGIDKVVKELKRRWETLGDRWWLRSGGAARAAARAAARR